MQRDAERRREQIVEAACQIVTEGGPAALTAQAVTKAVGVSRPLLYHYFDTMEALLDEVVSRHVARFEADLDRWAEQIEQADVPSPRDAMVIVVGNLRNALVDDCALSQGISQTSPAYLGYVARCSAILAQRAEQGDIELTRAMKTQTGDLASTTDMFVFGLCGVLATRPDIANDEIASIALQMFGIEQQQVPQEEPVEKPKAQEASKVGFFKRIFG